MVQSDFRKLCLEKNVFLCVDFKTGSHSQAQWRDIASRCWSDSKSPVQKILKEKREVVEAVARRDEMKKLTKGVEMMIRSYDYSSNMISVKESCT